jgi:hypothetical protein
MYSNSNYLQPLFLLSIFPKDICTLYMYVFDIVPFAVHLEDLGDGRFVGVEAPFSQNISLGSGLSLYLERGRPNALRMNLGTEEARVRLPSLDTEVRLKGKFCGLLMYFYKIQFIVMHPLGKQLFFCGDRIHRTRFK